MVMWKHLLLLGSLGCCLAALADSDKDATNTTPSEELSTNAADLGSVEEVIETKDGSLGEVESAVISLQSMDFAGALQAHSLLMVKFSAPWCEHSAAIKPEYEETAKLLKQEGSPIRLADVDASKEKVLAKREGAHSYPLLKWYKAGRPAGIYRQGREKLTLVDWLRSKTSALAVEVNSDKEAQLFLELNQVSVLGMFPTKGSEGEQAFVEASYLFDTGVGFAVLRYLQAWAVRDTVWIRAKHFEGQEIYEDELTVKKLAEFVTLHSTPHVVEFKQDDWKTIFRDNRNQHFIFFANKGSTKADFDVIETVAKSFKKEMVFVLVDTDNVENEKICQIFDIKATDAPTLRMATTTKRVIRKFKPEEENLTEENIRKFVARVKDGSLEPYMTREESKMEDISQEKIKEEL